MRLLGRTVYRRLEWMERPLDPVQQPHEASVPLTDGFLDVGDAEEIARVRPGLGLAAVRARFARGDRCFGSRHDGRLVSLTWVSRGVARIEYLDLACVLPPRTAFQYDRWTDPAQRGLRIAPSSGSRLSRTLAAEGDRLLTCCVLRENEAAVANARRAGYRTVGTVGWVGIGPVRRAFRRRPAHHV
jgi:hypothetical protein